MWFYITFDFRTPDFSNQFHFWDGVWVIWFVQEFFSLKPPNIQGYEILFQPPLHALRYKFFFFSAGYFFSRYFLARYIFSPEICLKSPIPLPTPNPLQNLSNFGTFQIVGTVVPLGTLPKLSLFSLKNKEGLAPFVSSVVEHTAKALGTKLQSFHNSIVSQFPVETWAQRKPNQIFKWWI